MTETGLGSECVDSRASDDNDTRSNFGGFDTVRHLFAGERHQAKFREIGLSREQRTAVMAQPLVQVALMGRWKFSFHSTKPREITGRGQAAFFPIERNRSKIAIVPFATTTSAREKRPVCEMRRMVLAALLLCDSLAPNPLSTFLVVFSVAKLFPTYRPKLASN